MSDLSKDLLHSGPGHPTRLELRPVAADGTVQAEADSATNRVLIVEYKHDDAPENPLTSSDGWGHIYSLSRRHRNYDPERIRFALENNPDAVGLSYFEHGNCLWGVEGTMGSMPDFRWDGVSLAGAWIPDDCVLEACPAAAGTPERVTWMQEQAARACEVYTQWCNGWVYFLRAEVYDLRHDEDGPILDADYYKDNKDPLDESACSDVYEDGAVVVLDDLLSNLALKFA